MPHAPRIGLIGCGRWGRSILRDLVQLRCETFVADSAPSAHALARDIGARATVANATELPPVDGIVIASPTSTHAAMVQAIASRAVPIFCEKPLTADLASAEALSGALHAPLFMMDKWRYHPGIECLRDVARSQTLGPVRGLRTTRFGWENMHDDVDAVWILAPHDLSIALEILGEIPAPRAAVAERSGGRVTGICAILGNDPWLAVDVSTRNGQRQRRVELHCRDGLAVLADAYDNQIAILRNGSNPGDAERRAIGNEMPLLRELRVFVEFLSGGAPPRSTLADGVGIVRSLTALLTQADNA
jgi:predicted dehydrogenase